jgi:predicted nucleotidyltransferase
VQHRIAAAHPELGGLQWSIMSSAALSIELSQSVIARIARTCRYWHIRRLALFGSILRDDYGPDSDVDVLVEFEPGHVPFIITIQDELTEIFGRRVDSTPRQASASTSATTLEWHEISMTQSVLSEIAPRACRHAPTPNVAQRES